MGIAFGASLKIGVGQIIERDHLIEFKQALFTAVQEALQSVLVLQQTVRNPIELLEAQGGEVLPDELPERALALQPAVGGALAARCRQAPDQRPHRGRPLGSIEAELLELPVQSQLTHRR